MDPQQRRYRHPSTCTALATRSTLPLTRGDVGPARRNPRTYRTAVRGGRRAVTDAAANPSSSRSVVAVWSPLSASLAVYVLGSSETAATFWPGQNRWLSLYFRFPSVILRDSVCFPPYVTFFSRVTAPTKITKNTMPIIHTIPRHPNQGVVNLVATRLPGSYPSYSFRFFLKLLNIINLGIR
jgi:hypothetical protein